MLINVHGQGQWWSRCEDRPADAVKGTGAELAEGGETDAERQSNRPFDAVYVVTPAVYPHQFRWPA